MSCLACDCPDCLDTYDGMVNLHHFDGFRFIAAHCPAILNGHPCSKLDEHPGPTQVAGPPSLTRAKLLTLRANGR